jgi:hypothetical protein
MWIESDDGRWINLDHVRWIEETTAPLGFTGRNWFKLQFDGEVKTMRISKYDVPAVLNIDVNRERYRRETSRG